MKQITFFTLVLLTSFLSYGQDLILTGVFDGPLSGGTPKAIEIYVVNDVADLSTYGIGSANNGGGTDGVELQFAGTATAGDYLYVTAGLTDFNTFFGFDADFETSAAGINGDDAIELFGSVTDDGSGGLTGTVIDTFGDINTDGSGQPWDYLDGWAYRFDGTGPEGSTFTVGNWMYSGVNANDDDTSQDTATNPWPLGTYSTSGATEPTLTVSSPSMNQVFPSGTTSVDVVFSTMNFDLTGDNVVEYIVNGAAAVTTQSSPITVPTVDGESYTVVLELKNADGALIPPVATTIAFSVTAAQSVATIAELRALDDGTEAILTGEAILTFQQEFRNQKWIQDDTGAIAIDDSPGIITSVYQRGDGITGITGTVGSFNGFKQFSPGTDPGAPTSTGNTVTPQIVTADMLNASPEDYESELVTIEEATIDNTASTTWTTGTEFPMATPNGNYVFRTSFFGADYIDSTVPTTAVNVTGIITERNNGSYFITARDQADFESATACGLLIGDITTTCDSETTGVDGVTVNIAFTGGTDDTFTITSDVGAVGGDNPSTIEEGIIIITSVSEAVEFSVFISSTGGCDLTIDVTTPACEPANEVATLAELRQAAEDEEYTITGEIVLTFQQDFRNQKFFEDTTAGILIDDTAGALTTAYNVGDGITGLTGTLSSFNGQLQFVPSADAGAASSTGNAVEAQEVTIPMLIANPEDYESEFVEIMEVTIDNTANATWVTGTEYPLTNGSDTYTFRTSFFDADYIGQDVPTFTANVAGIITERNNGSYFITAREASDITEFLSVEDINALALSMYPNPASDIVTISTVTNAEKTIIVYDVTGKIVIETIITTELDVRSLDSGLYLVQITENGVTATSKLIKR